MPTTVEIFSSGFGSGQADGREPEKQVSHFGPPRRIGRVVDSRLDARSGPPMDLMVATRTLRFTVWRLSGKALTAKPRGSGRAGEDFPIGTQIVHEPAAVAEFLRDNRTVSVGFFGVAAMILGQPSIARRAVVETATPREHASTWPTSCSSIPGSRCRTGAWRHALPYLGKRANLPVACLPLLAALTPGEHTVTLIDENVEPIDFERCARADIVGVTGMSVQRHRMKEILAELKRRGAFTVVGGPLVTVQEDYFDGLADVIFIGEAEETWPQFLTEWKQGGTRSATSSSRRPT